MIVHILWLLFILLPLYKSQTWPSSYNTTFEAIDLKFEFTGDDSRNISLLTFDSTQTYLYGFAEGSSAVLNDTIIFKANVELVFQWTVTISEPIDANNGVYIDDTNGYLYFHYNNPSCIIIRMHTSNGTLQYVRKMSDVLLSWEFLALNVEQTYLYPLVLNGKKFQKMNLSQNWIMYHLNKNQFSYSLKSKRKLFFYLTSFSFR